MSTSVRNPHHIIALPSTLAANTAEGSLVTLQAGADATVGLPSGASPTTPLFGLLFQATPPNPAGGSAPVQVVTSGIFPGIAGTAITRGSEVTAYDALGNIGPVVAGTAGTNCAVIGIALETAATGERCAILVRQYIKQY